ncbi:MAG: hypothetical protein R3C12_24385, partial [Planctomycetaceae bacterium]
RHPPVFRRPPNPPNEPAHFFAARFRSLRVNPFGFACGAFPERIHFPSLSIGIADLTHPREAHDTCHGFLKDSTGAPDGFVVIEERFALQ